MEQLAARLAKKLSISMEYDQEKEQVLAYGFIAMLQFISLFLIALTIGLFAGFAYESLVIFFGVGFLRKSTGGAHSSTMNGCMIMSSINIALLAFFSRRILLLSISNSYYIMGYTLCYLLCIFIIYRYVPMDSPNKRITSAAKIARLRKQSFITIGCYLIITLLLTSFSGSILRFRCIANSMCLLSLWQCFTVTPAGASFIGKLDQLFFKQP